MAKVDSDLRQIYLEPGHTCLVRAPAIVKTVLGSCVGVAFRIPRLGVGALCHPMLPCSADSHANPVTGRRYVDFAIRELAAEFDALGAHREEVQVKLFGGADVLLTGSGKAKMSVGRVNYETALRVLEEEGFAVQASSLGGKTGVHIQFHTGTGEVLLRRLRSVRSTKAARK